jgi:hypothetical protein
MGMFIRRAALVIGALAALGAVAAASWHLALRSASKRDHGGESTASPPSQRRLKALQNEIETLERALAERGQADLERKSEFEALRRRLAAVESGLTERAEHAGSSDPDLDLTRDEERTVTDARFARVDSMFTGEPRNNAWAKGAEDGIRATITETQYAGSKLDSMDCKSQICRLEVEHSSETAQAMWRATFPGKLTGLPMGAFRHVDDESGRLVDVAYFANVPLLP